jgi:hypothetical protein
MLIHQVKGEANIEVRLFDAWIGMYAHLSKTDIKAEMIVCYRAGGISLKT